jgi:uncharacterized protein YbjT (DUF2867 family)
MAGYEEETVTQKTAILLGATGLVGSFCLIDLIDQAAYSRVRALLRKPLASNHEKVEQKVMDLNNLTPNDFSGADDVFCSLGTTIAVAGSQAAFRAIDYELPLKAARAAREAGAEQFILVSSASANPESSNFYLRTKGELERDLEAIGFKALHIFRPGLLLGSRREFRFSERMAQRIGPFLNAIMWGPLRQYRSIAAQTVAQAMVQAALSGQSGVHFYHYDDIVRLARG